MTDFLARLAHRRRVVWLFWGLNAALLAALLVFALR
jgi:hypothetical protein